MFTTLRKAVPMSFAVGALLFLPLGGCEKSSKGEAEHEHAHGKTDEHGHSEEGHAHKEKHDHSHDSHGHEGHEHSGGEHEHDEGEEGHAGEVTLTAEAISASGIKLEPARKQALVATRTVPARVAFNAEATAHVGTSIPGRVTAVRVKLGDSVKKADPLLVIDSPEFGVAQSELLQRRSDVQVARTNVEVVKTAFERASRLLEGKGIAKAEFQRREGEYKAAQGQLLSAESGFKAASNKLKLLGMSDAELERFEKTGTINSQIIIRAPIDGRVTEKEVTLGEVVGPESPPLLVLADMTTLWVLADVPEGVVHQVALGAPARVVIPSLANHVVEGKVAYVDPKINPQSRSAAVRIEVPGENSPLQPGMFGQAEIVGGEEKATDAIVVPAAAIQNIEGGPALFVPVEGEANTFTKRPVTVGTPISGMVPILSGLNEGEQYVVAGSFTLKADLGKQSAAHSHDH